jgi:beta-1,4-N-acetylglucosaminyltransferase
MRHRLEKPLTLRYVSPKDTSAQHRPSYILFVLGSGGHTKEMLAMMETGFGNFVNLHRRYVISSGDNMSLKHLDAFEKTVATEAGSGRKIGSYDSYIVPRARRIHQSLLTTPFTAIWSIVAICPLLLRVPSMKFNKTGYIAPDIIVTNGPATGFFVCLVAYLLKMVYVIPESSAQVLFIESWARIHSLSLTGKCFHFTGIADLFLVQHQQVADRYAVANAGCLVFNRKG